MRYVGRFLAGLCVLLALSAGAFPIVALAQDAVEVSEIPAAVPDDAGNAGEAVDVVALLEMLLPFVPEEYRAWVGLALFVLSVGGYVYVSMTAAKDDDGWFKRYLGGFRRLAAFLPKKKPPSAPRA